MILETSYAKSTDFKPTLWKKRILWWSLLGKSLKTFYDSYRIYWTRDRDFQRVLLEYPDGYDGRRTLKRFHPVTSESSLICFEIIFDRYNGTKCFRKFLVLSRFFFSTFHDYYPYAYIFLFIFIIIYFYFTIHLFFCSFFFPTLITS